MANLADRGAKAPTSVSDRQDSQKGPIEVVGLVVRPLENVTKRNWLFGWV